MYVITFSAPRGFNSIANRILEEKVGGKDHILQFVTTNTGILGKYVDPVTRLPAGGYDDTGVSKDLKVDNSFWQWELHSLIHYK